MLSISVFTEIDVSFSKFQPHHVVHMLIFVILIRHINTKLPSLAVTTRSQAKKDGEASPLKVPSYQESPIVDKQKLKQMQSEDTSEGSS